jgi:hypothetical protein
MVRRSRDPSRFPPVQLQSDLAPWDDPSYIPPNPMSLPPPGQLPRFVPNDTIGAPPPPPNPAPLLPGQVPSSGPNNGQAIRVSDQHHYAQCINGTFRVPQVTGPAGLAISQPVGKRNLLILRNAAAAGNVFVSFGAAADGNSSIRLAPGVMVLFDVVVPQDDVYVFADAAAVDVSYTYSTIAGTPA